MIIEQQSARLGVKPKQAEKKTEVPDARRDERLHRRGGCAWFVIPKANQQIGSKPHQFPGDEEEEQIVGDDDSQHGGREEGEKTEKPGEILVMRHVSGAVN